MEQLANKQAVSEVNSTGARLKLVLGLALGSFSQANRIDEYRQRQVQLIEGLRRLSGIFLVLEPIRLFQPPPSKPYDTSHLDKPNDRKQLLINVTTQ